MPQPEIADEQARADELDETVDELEAELETQPDDEQTAAALEDAVDDDQGESEPDSDDVEIEEVELTDDDLADGDLFAGVDDVEDDEDDETGEESTSDQSNPADEFTFSGDNPTSKLQTSIEDGAAKLATVGLDDETQEALEDDLQDVFSAFRLGYYGAEFANEYILVDGDDDVDPAWALLGSSLACAAVAVAMRPDSDEQIARLKEAANLGGASA
ncbi:acyl-CoA dehydrogenase [Natrialbaceae archaeon AArc-T1-2]|uniref:acyl-CoA dehydrogenase n=1 Tax=Natrialbaceae archaeon AArc-T1-2 TaxID=3053904 RepID=UPI00255B1669|nr:acyl-CoA dehydrogenase [Natrialbaceae archaeon AArc-T1-2]WIV67541.1 acyl-CoA dehydrogenase [Natrialbaceae archaeon AArc-T1-2]